MSLFSAFVDAFKKAAGKKPDIDIKTYGPLGSTTQTEAGEAFTPHRPAPAPDTKHGPEGSPSSAEPDAPAP